MNDSKNVRKILFFILKIGIAAGILIYLVRRSNLNAETFSRIPWWCLVLAGVCLLTQILLSAVRWYSLMRALSLNTRLREAVFLTMQGVFFTLFVPGGSVGGDLVKGAILAKRADPGQKFDGVFSILADRLVGRADFFFRRLFFRFFCGADFPRCPTM